MTYEVFVCGGASLEIDENKFKFLTISIERKEQRFIVYGADNTIISIIFIDKISLIKLK